VACANVVEAQGDSEAGHGLQLRTVRAPVRCGRRAV